MATDDFQVSIGNLYYERQRLSALVFKPLQEIKDFVAQNLRPDEIARIVGFLGNAIRSDTLRTITDGEALLAVLNLYYGKDNLRVLQRLLRKINCHDLLDILNDWDVTSNPVDTQVFRECGYSPLWVRIKSNFSWFSGNRKMILQTIRRLFRIPEITPGDPDCDTVIFMGVSFGKTELLVYVLVPLCACKYIHASLGRNDINLALLQSGISGVYFGRKSKKNGFNDDPANTSFASINESLQGDYIKQGQVLQELHPAEMNGLYNGIQEQNQRYSDDKDSNQGVAEKDSKVVQASFGYIDTTPSVEPIRIVRPKIMYLDHGNVSARDVEDSPKKRAAVDEEMVQNIVRDSTYIVEQTPQSFNNNNLYKKSVEFMPAKFQQNEQKENLRECEVESLIIPEVRCNRKEDWKFPDALSHVANQEYYNSENMKKMNYGRSDNGERRIPVLDFSEEDTNDNYNNKGWQSFPSPQHLPSGASAGQSTESNSKKLFTSTATLQVNMRNRNANYHGQPRAFIDDKIYKPEAVTSLNMSKPKRTLSPSRRTQNGSWYEDDALEDYYREMVPEPEPEETQQLYQNDEFFQYGMIPEEEATTPKGMNEQHQTPLFSPPAEFRDATPTGRRLVKVKTKFFEQLVQQPSLISTENDNRAPHNWDNSSLTSDRLRQVPRQTTVTNNVNRPPEHSSVVYNQHRLEPVFVHPRPFLMKSESKLESEYEDSVFTDTESHVEIMTSSRFAPPPYHPPPEYNGTANKSAAKFSDDSVSTDTSDRIFKSHLLSAASVSSICKEKEMFLSHDELQMSLRGAEDKEMERQMELCKELMIAAKAGDEEEVKRTIEEGVNVDYQNEFGQSAMMVASWEGHLGIVEALLSAEADPNLEEGFGKSALHEAAVSGQHTIVHRLISGGAKINLTDEEHRTPLHYAAMRGKRRIVEVLLLFGADVTLLTKYGESAVELAYSYHHDDIVNFLMSSSRDEKTRKEMESQIRKQKLRQLSSATSLPNLSKVSSMKELSRSRSRPDLRKKKSVCSIQ